MSRAQFDVSLNPDGTGTVRLNGEELSGVEAIRIDGARNATPLVTLKLAAGVHVEGIGELGSSEDDAAEELIDLLDALDPTILDREVLEGASLGDPGGGAVSYLEAIRRCIRGD